MIAAFALFSGLATEGFVQVYGDRIERQTEEDLEKDRVLISSLLREQERKVGLLARFVADMIELSEDREDSTAGQQVLAYVVDYLGGERVEPELHRGPFDPDHPHASLLRKGRLGIRTTQLSVDRRLPHTELAIAGCAPIERATGIDAVVVATYRLDDASLMTLKEKQGADISLIHDGEVVASTIAAPERRAVIGALVAPEAQRRIVGGRESLVMDAELGGEPHKVILHPLEVGFRSDHVFATSRSMRGLAQAIRTIRREALLVAGLVLVGAVILYSFVIRRVTRPIADLAQVTRRIAEGEVGRRVAVTTGDEVGDLGASFNRMIETIEAKQRELAALHQQKLSRAERLATIGELAASIAHEVRNPLAGIRGAIQLVLDDFAGSEEQASLLRDVSSEVDRMEQLTHDLLTYARPNKPNLREADLSRIMEKAVFFAEQASGGSEVVVHRDYGDDVPEVQVDPDQIGQVFMNILMNAVQAMPDGGAITVRTGLVTGDGGRRVRVDVSDEGVGMSEATREKALDPFYTTKHRGTGLGLSIVQRIVEAHGASISIASEVGKGTTFSILFRA